MIRENVYDTAWWGEPVGVITDAAFFALDETRCRSALEQFSWVEFKAPLAQAPSLRLLHERGFILADVQIPFRLALKAVPDSPSLAEIGCQSASQAHFEVSPHLVRDFEHERFLQLPGIVRPKLNERYARWANQMIGEHPDWSLCIRHNLQVQGWFLSQPTPRGLSLTLAMMAKSAVLSGSHLFQKAIRTYAGMGATIGYASFSVRNTPVLNIYSQFGAKFLPPEGNWLWPGKASRGSNHAE
jgi:hypothetical protein